MTEQESFEQYWNSLASDPTDSELLVMQCRYAAKNAWKVACKWQRSVCNEELLALRQQVNELESYVCNDVRDLKIDLDTANARVAELEAEQS